MTTDLALSQFTVGGNLDQHDVLAVVTSKAEETYEAEMKRCRDEAAALNVSSQKLANSITERAAVEAVAAHRRKAKSVMSVLSDMRGKAKLEAQVENFYKTKGDLRAVLRIEHGGGGYGNYVNFDLTSKPSKALLDMVKEYDAARAEIVRLQNEAVDWKKKFNNIPMLERKYRARLAAAKLQTSVEGQKLLDMLTGDLDKNIRALPSGS